MKEGRELAKNTLIISVGKICTQIVSFLLLPLYTGILSTEEYGAVDLIVTYISLLVPIATLQLDQAIFRFVLEKRGNKDVTKHIVSTILTMIIISLLTISLVGIIIAQFVTNIYKYYILGLLLSTSYVTVMLQVARGFGNNKVYAFGSFLNASINVVANVVTIVFLHLGAQGMLIANILANLLAGSYIFFILKVYKYFKICNPQKGEIKKYLEYSWPLIPNSISWWILSASDRTIILAEMGVSYNGIYSIAGKFSHMYSIMYNIFNLSWTEILAVHFNDENRTEIFRTLQDSVVKILLCVYLEIVAVMPFIFPIMIDIKYADAYYQIPILMLGVFFSAMIGTMSAYYIADKNTKVIANTTIMCALINIVVNLALIRFIGLFAASISSAVAYISMYIIRYRDIRIRYGIKNSRQIMWGMVILTVMAFICYYLQNLIVQIIWFFIITIISLILNRKLIVSMLAMLKSKMKK